MINRRDFLAGVGALGGVTLLPADWSLAPVMADPPAPPAEYKLPPLPYDYKALEPHIDEATMKIHHDKHHQAYVDGLNKALAALAAAREKNDFGSIQGITRQLAFHAGGFFNHIVFWNNMAAAGSGGGGKPAGGLADAINRDFGSLDKFTAQFTAAAVQVEGNGWGVLAYHSALRR